MTETERLCQKIAGLRDLVLNDCVAARLPQLLRWWDTERALGMLLIAQSERLAIMTEGAARLRAEEKP